MKTENKYIDNSLFIELVSNLTEKIVSKVIPDSDLIIENDEVRYNDKDQNYFNEVYEEIEAELNSKGIYSDTDQYEKFARKCDATGKGMNEGYCFGYGVRYFKEESDALTYAKELGYNTLEEAFTSDEYYYTEWEHMIEDDEEWYDADGNTYKNCHKCKQETIVREESNFCQHCLTHL